MTAQDTQVIVRPTSSDDVREYHIVGDSITQVPYSEFWHPLLGEESEFDKLGPKGKKIARSLMDKGHQKFIARAVFRPQSIRVYKTHVADWSTVEPSIVMEALKGAFGANIAATRYGSAKQRELAMV